MAFVLIGLLEKITIHLNHNYFLYDLQHERTYSKEQNRWIQAHFVKLERSVPKSEYEIWDEYSARLRFGTMSPGACTHTISIPLATAGSCHGDVGFQLYRTRIGICLSYQQPAGIQGTPEVIMEQVGFQLYRTCIRICLSYQQQAGIQGTVLP